MLHELRIYDFVPGRANDWHKRTAEVTKKFHRKYGINVLGYFTDAVGISNRVTYLVQYNSLAEREKQWEPFLADPDRLQAFKDSEQHTGPFILNINNAMLQTTPYSPMPKPDGDKPMLYELRVYDVMQGKMSALNSRFADMNCAYFEQYDIKQIGYWTDLIGPGGRLTYMLAYDSMADREKKWATMGANQERRAKMAETEKDGALVRTISSSLLQPTAYSSMK